MKLVNILCKDCQHHSDSHTNAHREFSTEFPQGRIATMEDRPQEGYVYCEKLAELCSDKEYNMEMPKDGFCSYGEPEP